VTVLFLKDSLKNWDFKKKMYKN